MRSGARGWIVGSWICLWLNAFDRYGPFLLARFSGDGISTQIKGRAGSNLGGLIIGVMILGPVVLVLVVGFLASDHLSGVGVALAMFFVGIWGLLLWSGHAFRKDADPLVRFLEKTLRPTQDSAPPNRPARATTRPLQLIVNGKPGTKLRTTADIDSALDDLKSDDFLILEELPEDYIQTARVGDDFIIERREGSHSRHYEATRTDSAEFRSSARGPTFTRTETANVLVAYAMGEPFPSLVAWKKKWP